MLCILTEAHPNLLANSVSVSKKNSLFSPAIVVSDETVALGGQCHTTNLRQCKLCCYTLVGLYPANMNRLWHISKICMHLLIYIQPWRRLALSERFLVNKFADCKHTWL